MTTDNQRFYFPGRLLDPKVKDRKQRFDEMNSFVTQEHGWIVSVPGAVEVVVEVLEGSLLPDILRQMGHRLREEPPGQRILHTAIVERFARRPGGELELLTEGSSRPVDEVRHHAGIVPTRRFSFALP